MSERLGKLVAVHALAPAHIQRAAFIAVLSFLFFLATMFLFYIRQSMLYFLLASAFLVVYVITMLSWVIQRKNVVQVFEHGFSYKSRQTTWEGISDVGDDGMICLHDGKPIIISPAINDLPNLLALIRGRSQR